MKILLSFVGEQDPVSDKTNTEGSIVTLSRHLNPDRVVLFPTAQIAKSTETKTIRNSETESRAAETAHWLQSELRCDIPVDIFPLQISNPTDYTAILPELHRKLRLLDVLSDTENTETHLNFSSGTPQQKSVWLLMANAGLFPNCRLWQVNNPEYVEGETDRIREVEITFLEEENIVGRLDEFSRQFLFERMREDMGRLRHISLHPDRRTKAALLQKLFAAYQEWDCIKYGDAHMALRDILARLPATPEHHTLRELLTNQTEYTRRLKNSGNAETPENLADIYFSARRRYMRGDYTDALTRFWRVYEGLLYRRLRERYGIEASYPKNCKEGSALDALREMFPEVDKAGHIAMGVMKSHAFLNTGVKDAEYTQFLSGSESYGQILQALRETRNQSMAAHGMKPVEQQDARKGLEAVEALYRIFIPQSQALDKFPLGRTQLQTVVDFLAKSFSG